MGRPLKIAKAQAVITLTATDATTDVVTTSANLNTLGIIAGMPFIPASNIGGLVAGTTYWILKVLTATTFTVSATPLNANPTSTPVNLSGTTGQTVAATVAPVDLYFNNPNGSANTYSVVGGNTAIIGNQVSVAVAFGVAGSGALYASDASDVVGGLGTDLGNVAAGSVIQYIAANGQPVTLGYVDTATGVTSIEISNATATGNFLTSVGNAQTLYANLPVVFDADIGGLTAGATYFVKKIANASAFSVSLTPGGANVALSDEDATANASQDTTILVDNASANLAGASYIYATPEDGYIVRQKGKSKYLVKGTTTGITGALYTYDTDKANLLPNTCSMTATFANAATAYVLSLSDHNAELYNSDTGNTPVEGNLVLANATPVYASFNTAAAANAANGQPYPIVTITGA